MRHYDPIPIHEIYDAQRRIAQEIVRTPLVRLNVDDAPAEIYLKLENLQPIGVFKLRGLVNAMRLLGKEQLEAGVWTASTGNMANATAWYAQRLGIPCAIVVPEHVPHIKEAALQRQGAHVVKAPVNEWLNIFQTRAYPGMDGVFIHAFSDPAVMAGNGTIALEIVEDFPEVDTVLMPWGGGGLCCGVASGLRALKPSVKLFACEITTCTPLAASFANNAPAASIDYTPSFVEGIGYPVMFPEMWHLAQHLLDGSLIVTLQDTVTAIKVVAERNCVIAEGAGAVSVAAALTGQAGQGKVVCILSGGNIDPTHLITIFQDKVPMEHERVQ